MLRKPGFVRSRLFQWVIGGAGVLLLGALLITQVGKDLRAPVAAWYFHSTYVYLLVMAVASIQFSSEWSKLRRSGVDVSRVFKELPPE